MKNFYKILGIDDFSDIDVVKNAYRKLSMQYHPDNFINASEEIKNDNLIKQQELNEAWTILSKEDKKREYDEKLKMGDLYESDYNIDLNNLFNNMFSFYSSTDKEETILQNKIRQLEQDIAERERKIRIESSQPIMELRKQNYNLFRKSGEIGLKISSQKSHLNIKKSELNELYNKPMYKIMPSKYKKIENILKQEIEQIQMQINLLESQEEVKQKEMKNLTFEEINYEKNAIENDPIIIELRKELEELKIQKEQLKKGRRF